MTMIPSLEDIWNLYGLTRSQLWDLRSEVLDCLEGRAEKTDQISAYIYMSSAQVRDLFDHYLDELDKMIMLNLFAALEGCVRADFDDRVQRRKKDALSQCYREIERSGTFPRGRASFEMLFDAWKRYCPTCKGPIGEIKGFWYYRNWLAHGRWWVFKKNPAPDVNRLKLTIQDLLMCLDISFA